MTRFSLLTRLNNRFSDFSNLPAEVIFRPLRFFTIFGVLGLRFKWGWSRGKLRHGATSPLKGGEPSSAPKTLKIIRQQIRLTALYGLSWLSLGWWPITGVL
jgi:hypothetical protein